MCVIDFLFNAVYNNYCVFLSYSKFFVESKIQFVSLND